MKKLDQIREFETARSERYPWLDGATTRVPRLSAVKEEDMPSDTPSHQLSTPTAEEWRAEVRARRAAKRQQRQQAAGMHTKAGEAA